MRLVALPLVLVCACGDDSSRESAASAATQPSQGSIGTLTNASLSAGEADGTATQATTGGAPTTGATGETGEDEDTGAASTLPKFDFGVQPDVAEPMPDTGCTKVDLLFVIDSSGSMEDEQVVLVQSFPDFVAEMQTQLADTDSYHIGVVSSDAYPFNDPACAVDGALVTQTGGAGSSNSVCTPFATGKRWLDQSEPNLNQKFSCAGQVGINGDGNERPIHAMITAVGAGMNGPGACNDGFIRPDALLVVVLITDEEDDHEVQACNMVPQPGSPGEPPGWFQGLVAAKAGIETNIVVLSLIGPTGQPCPALDKCGGGIIGAELSPRLVEFTEMFTYGIVGQICAPSYKQFFSDAIAQISSACEGYTPPG